MTHTRVTRLPRAVALLLVMLAVLLAGCSTTIAHKQLISGHDGPRHILVFFDGTANDEVSDTNVKRLHSLVTLQDRADISALYVEGVGTGADIAGMGAGLGMSARVRLAYEFLLKHRRDEHDRIYLVGFSRGAYAARILNSLLYHAGLPKLRMHKTPGEMARDVYDTVDMKVDVAEETPQAREAGRRERLERRGRVAQRLADFHGIQQGEPVRVEVLALWDTVASIGPPDWGKRVQHRLRARLFEPTVDSAHSRYGDTLCNVRHAFQALAIDDEREWIFTPLPLTRRHLWEACPDPAKTPMHATPGGKLQEVWFAGAHSDVGGGYRDTLLSGVSLNWMIEQLQPFGLLPPNTRVRQDVHGTSHDPESGAFAALYRGVNRNMVRYALSDESTRMGTICVHHSVLERRQVALPKDFENDQLVLQQEGPACLQRNEEPADFDLYQRFYEKPRQAGACQAEVKIVACQPGDIACCAAP